MPETSHRGSRASKAEATEPEAKTTEATEPEAKTTDVEQVDPSGDAAPPEHVDVPVSQLVDRAPEFLGYPSHTAMGALSDSLDETMTVDAAKAKVEEWLQKPVEVDEPKPSAVPEPPHAEQQEG